MELQNFISEALAQISNGISDAQEKLNDSTGIVNPRFLSAANQDRGGPYGWIADRKDRLREVHLVEFDVAVYAVEGKETKAGIGIMVASIGLGAGGKSQAENSTQSRIKFAIPMAFPPCDKDAYPKKSDS